MLEFIGIMKLQLLLLYSRYSVVILTSKYNNFTSISKSRFNFSLNSYKKSQETKIIQHFLKYFWKAGNAVRS